MSIYQDHTYKHGIGWSTWHFQWVTKYRYRVFSNARLQKLCEIFLMEAARRHKFEIDELEVAADHVHVIAKLRPSMSPARAVQLLKGYSARMLFKTEELPLKSFYWRKSGKRSLWGDGKFFASVGYITLETAKEYVQNHETHDAQNRNPHHLWLGRRSNNEKDIIRTAQDTKSHKINLGELNYLDPWFESVNR